MPSSEEPLPPSRTRRLINFVGWRTMELMDAGLFILGIIVLAGFLARYSWAADMCATFRVQYLFFLLPATIGYLIFRRRRVAWFLLACTIANVIPMTPYLIPHSTNAAPAESNKPTRIMLWNVLISNQDHDDVVSYVKENDPDIFIALESDAKWTRGLQPLETWLPHRHLIDDRGTASMSVYSRIPFDQIEPRTHTRHHMPSIDMTVTIDNRPINIVVTHPFTPLTPEDAKLRNQILQETAEAMPQDTSRILIGDFNMTPWTPLFSDILKTANVRPASYGRGVRPTWYRRARMYGPLRDTWLFALKLDHVLLSQDLEVVDHRIGPEIGSDHRAVIVDFR